MPVVFLEHFLRNVWHQGVTVCLGIGELRAVTVCLNHSKRCQLATVTGTHLVHDIRLQLLPQEELSDGSIEGLGSPMQAHALLLRA